MPTDIETFLTTSILAFALAFVRIGTAVMIMPGLGDSFTPERIRLLIAVALSIVLFPLISMRIPSPLPGTEMLLVMIITEFIVGAFFGVVARIFMMALDTAGMVISTSSGLSNAQVFNPSLSSQGSLIGAFLSVTGIVVLFNLNLHHLLIMGLVQSYDLFPLGVIPDTGSMAEFMSKAVNAAFAVGIKIGAPFLVLSILVYVGMGVLSRLMPQVQVFLLALPLQILLSIVLLMLVASAAFAYWAKEYEQAMVFFLSGG